MTEEKIRQWCYDIWPKHWKELAPSSNSRALFVKETIKLSPDDDMLKKIGLSIIAQTRHWRLKSKAEKVYGIPRLSQWIKDRRFDDEFIDESASAITERIRAKGAPCQWDGCNDETHGEKFAFCTMHYAQRHDRYTKLRKEKFDTLNILADGESVPLDVLAERCRLYLAAAAKSGKISMIPLKRLSDA